MPFLRVEVECYPYPHEVLHLSENFNGLIGFWRVEKNYEAKRKSKSHLRRDTYKIDTTIDASYFYTIMTSTIMPEIASKMNFDELDNARPCPKKVILWVAVFGCDWNYVAYNH